MGREISRERLPNISLMERIGSEWLFSGLLPAFWPAFRFLL